MDAAILAALDAYLRGEVSRDDLLAGPLGGLVRSSERLDTALRAALVGDQDLDLAIELLWLAGDPTPHRELLEALLVHPGHHHHQAVTRALQRIAAPASVPALRRALAAGFDHLAYTCSEPATIATWFSWALAAIGTDEAIAALREHAASSDPEVAAAMRHRLRRLGLDP